MILVCLGAGLAAGLRALCVHLGALLPLAVSPFRLPLGPLPRPVLGAALGASQELLGSLLLPLSAIRLHLAALRPRGASRVRWERPLGVLLSFWLLLFSDLLPPPFLLLLFVSLLVLLCFGGVRGGHLPFLGGRGVFGSPIVRRTFQHGPPPFPHRSWLLLTFDLCPFLPFFL